MVNLTVNGQAVQVPEGAPILSAAFASGTRVPTLCGIKGVSDIGACRVCVVEVEGCERLMAACNTPAEEGMAVRTDTPRVLEARRVNVQLMLSQHEVKCPTCVRNGNCVLQSLARELNVLDVPYAENATHQSWDASFPLIRDSAKCVRCLRCVQVCAKVQGCDVWDVKNRATRLDVDVRDGLPIQDAGCTLCGQCVTHCPTGALRERDDTDAVLAALADPDTACVAQVAPAVRTSWGEGLGLEGADASEGRLAATLGALGFDYVFDTNFAADMTIMEEGSEFLDRLGKRDAGAVLPMFTSCCPGWVRYVRLHRPDKLASLSSAKSPQQMFGALLKSYVAPKVGMTPPRSGADYQAGVREGAGIGIGLAEHPEGSGANDEAAVAAVAEGGVAGGACGAAGKRVFCVSFMPCVAKKYEAAVEEMAREGEPDVDAVLTVRELQRLVRLMHVDPRRLDERAFDDPMDEGSGAAVIFGATGGVMEAALRSAYYLVAGQNPDPEAFSAVRGADGWRERTFDMDGTPVRVAVASGLANAAKLLDALDAGEVEYDFVEVMACPGGCAGGGGQPIHEACELAAERGAVLYGLDKQRATRFSHENPHVAMCYEDYLEAPLSHRAEELLHTDQATW